MTGEVILNSQPIPAQTNAPNVIKAIVGVMGKVKEIKKEGWNKEGKYAFLYFGDVLAALQDAMVAEGLVIGQREVSRSIVSKILAIKYEFDAYHLSGEAIYNIASHTGACRFEFKSGSTDDKSFSKALVSCEKYGLLALFKIPPDDHATERTSDGDPDEQHGDREPAGFDDRDRVDDRRNGRRDEPEDRRADLRREVEEDRRAAQRDRRDPPDDDRRDNYDRDHPSGERQPPRDREPPRDERPRERRADQPSNTDPWDGPPAGRWDDPPPADVDLPPRSSEPQAGRWDDAPPYGAADEPSPPPRDPAEASGRARVIAFKEAFEKAISEDAAHDIWRQEEKLLASLADTTHDHLVAAYERKWGIYPPKLRG